MVQLRSALVLSLLFTLCACASFTKSREGNLTLASKAHTRAELVDVFGEPKDRETRGDVEFWYYKVYSNDSLRTYPYTAKLQGDKVLDFYSDTSHETAEEREDRMRRQDRGPTSFGPPQAQRY
jgi:hypothetical protein